MPFFAGPWFLLGLAALPALAGVYWLRNRFRRRTVSSLMLWLGQRRPREGGRRFTRIETPLLFFLELLALLLLGLAAAGPMVLSNTATRPLVVVLDDSFSMLAGGDDSPRTRATEALLDEVAGDEAYSVRFILAGTSPVLLGEPARGVDEVKRRLDSWQCHSPAGDCERAVALAGELGGGAARILVLTDRHAPESLEENSRIQWWAFGRAEPNVAFVNAARARRDNRDACLLEIMNFGAEAARPTLVVKALDDGAVLRRDALSLSPGEMRRLHFKLPDGTAGISAEIDDDALALDNRVWLLPDEARTVSVRVRMGNTELASRLARAMDATRRVDRGHTPAELIITDLGAVRGGDAWTVRFISDNAPVAYRGPFIIDRAHPLTRGLDLAGVVWGGSKTPRLPGRPVIAADDVPLMTDSERPGGAHDVRVMLAPKLSTFPESVDWPVFVWNLLDWRAGGLAGPRYANLRLGADAEVALNDTGTAVTLQLPEGDSRKLITTAREVTFRPTEVGVHRVEAGESSWPIAVNALSADESDLATRWSGRYGDWRRADALQWDYRNAAWMLLLAVLAVLVAHQLLLSRSRGHTHAGGAS
jgi:hypothetical protein